MLSHNSKITTSGYYYLGGLMQAISKISIFFLAFSSFFLMSCSSSFVQKINSNYNLSHNNANWIASFPIQDLHLEQEKHSDDETTSYYLFEDKKSGMVVSFYVEPAGRFKDVKSYRDFAWDKLKFVYTNATGVTKSDLPDAASIEYFIPSLHGTKINQLNMNIHYVKGDNWIDVHISKANFEESERSLFTNFINSISFIKKSADGKTTTAATPEKNDAIYYFAKGSDSYLKQDYKSAIESYEKAFEKESVSPRLEKKYWLVLIDNLGMCYGVTDNLQKSKTIFEYGISKEPSYPLFYYNLACVYAESDNLESCLSNLELAIRYKANMIEGEDFPDPMKDSSFQRYITNERFLQIVKKLKNG